MTHHQRLLAALADLVAAEQRPEALRTAALLRARSDSGTDAPPQPPSHMDAEIRATARCPGALPAAGLAAAAQDVLPWGTNPVAYLQPDRLDMVKAVATLLGPDGPILSPDLRFGLYYQRPGTYYGLHDHEADETYTILAGSALWTAGEDRRWRRAGDAIHHPCRMPHAFRAGPDGLLAIWRWSGDIRAETYRMLPDPETNPG